MRNLFVCDTTYTQEANIRLQQLGLQQIILGVDDTESGD